MPSAMSFRMASERDHIRRSARQLSSASISLGDMTNWIRTSFFSIRNGLHH